MNFTGFSQTLEPRKQTIENQTFFCFSISQSKFIAQELEYKNYCDSIQGELVSSIELERATTFLQDSAITILSVKVGNLERIIGNKDKRLEQHAKELAVREKEIRKQKRHKTYLYIGVGIIGILAIVIQ